MKSYVSKATIICFLLVGQSALSSQKFDFNFTYAGEKLALSQEAPDYYEALKQAAKSCFRHFKPKISGKQKGIELIDICANPKS